MEVDAEVCRGNDPAFVQFTDEALIGSTTSLFTGNSAPYFCKLQHKGMHEDAAEPGEWSAFGSVLPGQCCYLHRVM